MIIFLVCGPSIILQQLFLVLLRLRWYVSIAHGSGVTGYFISPGYYFRPSVSFATLGGNTVGRFYWRRITWPRSPMILTSLIIVHDKNSNCCVLVWHWVLTHLFLRFTKRSRCTRYRGCGGRTGLRSVRLTWPASRIMHGSYSRTTRQSHIAHRGCV
ncbi:hypothetical protein K439DRAFT_251479 [Ramaria rubella]|nr:hypothetical protein K439DRAFT_251479 [Ramaria rubella]